MAFCPNDSARLFLLLSDLDRFPFRSNQRFRHRTVCEMLVKIVRDCTFALQTEIEIGQDGPQSLRNEFGNEHLFLSVERRNHFFLLRRIVRMTFVKELACGVPDIASIANIGHPAFFAFLGIVFDESRIRFHQ